MPYHAAGEFFFNRGVGVTLQKGVWEATVFGSLRHISANIDGDSIHTYFTSFSTSGLHRTLPELQDKNNVQQASVGGSIKLHQKRFHIGINAVQYHFSKLLQKRNEPCSLFAINGSDWHNLSTDYNFTYRNLYFFGEAAVDKQGNTAFVNGLLASVDPKVDISLVHRQLAPAYQALYGNAFTENTAPGNERGFYMGLVVRPITTWRISSYADFSNSHG